MKIYLDDVREAPAGWIRAYWPDEVIAHLQSGRVTEVSLDHDLGDDTCGTGYNVVLWIEEAVVVNQFVPPKISIHSANPVGRDRMLRGIEAIKNMHGLNIQSRVIEVTFDPSEDFSETRAQIEPFRENIEKALKTFPITRAHFSYYSTHDPKETYVGEISIRFLPSFHGNRYNVYDAVTAEMRALTGLNCLALPNWVYEERLD